MALFDNLITVFVLLSLAALIYLRMTGKTLFDLFMEFRDIFVESQEEVLTYE